MFKRESAKGMGENEEVFDGAVDVNQTYWWHDKYRPRKPRYFNRVHTGYVSVPLVPVELPSEMLYRPPALSTRLG